MITAFLYPQCGTCRKTKKWLEDHHLPYKEIQIAENPPSKEQLRQYWQQSGLPLKKLFNTSGVKYKELQLKDRIPGMSEEEQLELLASDGMLIKRPILTDGKKATFGFDEKNLEKVWIDSHEG